MVALLDQRCGLCASAPSHQLHLVADLDFPAFDHEAVQRELTLETPVDTAGDLLVLG